MSGDWTDPPPFPPIPIRSTERIYDSPWCALRRDWLELEEGGKLQEYHVFEVTEAVAVVPCRADGSFVFVWQFRHPHGLTHWEIPAGRVQEGEDVEVAAHRELLEETGYRAGRLERMPGFYPVNGISPHHASLFVARDCEQVADPDLDHTERLSVAIKDEREVRERLLRGDFADGFTALALLYHFAREDGLGLRG